MVSRLHSCLQLLYFWINIYHSKYLPRACGYISCFPDQALSCGMLIFLQSDYMPYIFNLKLDLHALTFGWFSLLSTTYLSSRNWFGSYLIYFPPWNWDNNPHHHSFQEPCHSSVLKYWLPSASNAINLRSRIVFHWFVASPSPLVNS